jgi:GNAT superfamily N-acetyltransferase
LTVTDIIIKQLPNEDISRAIEIDRSERITTGYVFREDVLESQVVDWDVPRWSDDPSSGFSAQSRIEGWAAVLDRGGVLLGALDGEKLAGFAVLLPELSEGMAQLAALFVDRSYRRAGIASRLVEEVEKRAREAGAWKLYVSAIPSGSAVGFYLKCGFSPTHEVNEELFELEPDDIHMIKDIQPGQAS